MGHRPFIVARVLNGLQSFMAANGLDADGLARRAGIDWSACADRNAKIPVVGFLRLLDFAAKDSGDDAFGLRFAKTHSRQAIGLYHYIVVNCPTLRDALKSGARYMMLVTNAYEMRLEEDEDGGRFVWRFPASFEPRAQYEGYVTALAAEKVRMMLHPDWKPEGVFLEQPIPRRKHEYAGVLGPNVRFASGRTCLSFDKATLARTIEKADLTLHKEVESYGRLLLGLRDKGDAFPDAVRERIASLLPRGEATEKGVAASLGVSGRTLQRRLQDSGVTFRRLVDETRRGMAEHFMTKTDLPFTEVAFLLGYSELSALSRAVKAWFGVTPTGMRRRRHDQMAH